MNVIREYRGLNETEILEIFDSADVSGDDEKLVLVIDDLPPKYFASGVSEGWIKASDIVLDGIPLYRIFWQIRGGKFLHVLASLFIGGKNGKNENPVIWGNGTESIAKSQNCAAITFETKRRGHIVQAQSWGARITGVTMRKDLYAA